VVTHRLCDVVVRRLRAAMMRRLCAGAAHRRLIPVTCRLCAAAVRRLLLARAAMRLPSVGVAHRRPLTVAMLRLCAAEAHRRRPVPMHPCRAEEGRRRPHRRLTATRPPCAVAALAPPHLPL
jgi:hypothetical protein